MVLPTIMLMFLHQNWVLSRYQAAIPLRYGTLGTCYLVCGAAAFAASVLGTFCAYLSVWVLAAG